MKNKKFLMIVLAVIAIVLVIVGIVKLTGNKGEKINTLKGELNQEIWMKADEVLIIKDGDNQLKLAVDSDLNFDKNAEEYTYEVPYTLTVNDQEYVGNHTFAVGYSIHSEDNNMPYKVNMKDFENGSLQVVISVKEN